MAFACASLADGKAADGHADFYTVLLMHADRLLAPLVPESTSTAWRRDLARIVPEKIYRRQPTDATTNNWNLVAAAGEWMRTKAGLGNSLAWVEASLERQLQLFTPWGMYRDPNDPMAYDHFARLWALDLLDEGYRGRHAGALEELLERGCWMSLFMQSPNGDAPCGGRSAHHQWNEAQQAVTFESWASRFARRGDEVAARACKHGAIRSRNLARAGGAGRPANCGSSRTAWTRRRATATSRTRSTRSTTCWPRQCWPSPGPGGRPDRPGSVPGRCGALRLLAPAGIPQGVRPAGRPLPRVRHRRRPALQPDGAPPCAPARRSARDAVGRSQFGGGVSPAVQADAIRWRSGPSGATVRAPGMPSPTTAGTTSSQPSSCSSRATPTQLELRLTYRGRLRGGASAVVEQLLFKDGRAEIEHRVEGDVDAVRQCWPMLATDGATALEHQRDRTRQPRLSAAAGRSALPR